MPDGVPTATHATEATHKQQPAAPVLQGPVALFEEALPLTLSVQRAVADPSRLTPADVLALQRTVGNRAVSQLLTNAAPRPSRPTIQARLTVGPVGDHYEQEADRVAEQVVNMPAISPRARSSRGDNSAQRQAEEDATAVQAKPLAATITPLVQRQEEEKEVQMKPLPSTALRTGLQRQEEEEELQAKSLVQRQEEEEEEVQMKPRPDGSFEAGADLEQRLASQRGGGSPLPYETRAFMEPRFGADFGGVRVHTGGEAVQMTQELKAQAFTHGQDIYLGAGKHDPGSSAGKRLLAHELTHTIQQAGANKVNRRNEPERVRIQQSLPANHVNLKAVDMYLDFVKMKRKEIKWAKILLPKKLWSKKKAASDEGLYGHWWTEIGDLNVSDWNPSESYGWYPRKGVSYWQTLKGVKGTLNQEGPTSQHDPDEGKKADTEFHPVMTVDDKDDYGQVRDRVVGEIRAFAQGFKGQWSWKLIGRGKNCHTFQQDLMKKVGMKEKKAKFWLRELKDRSRQQYGDQILMLYKKVDGKPFGKVTVRGFEGKKWTWRGEEENWTRAEYKGREVFVKTDEFDGFVNAWTLHQGGEPEE